MVFLFGRGVPFRGPERRFFCARCSSLAAFSRGLLGGVRLCQLSHRFAMTAGEVARDWETPGSTPGCRPDRGEDVSARRKCGKRERFLNVSSSGMYHIPNDPIKSPAGSTATICNHISSAKSFETHRAFAGKHGYRGVPNTIPDHFRDPSPM